MSDGEGFRAPPEFGSVEAAGESLTGVIWAAGEFEPMVYGERKRVKVTEDTLKETFEALKSRLESGGKPVEIGFDHPKKPTVAAQTGLGKVGRVENVELSADGEKIVMTDSTITNEQAREEMRTGEFDELSFSIVGGISTGDPENGVTPLESVRIDRVDLVMEGAVPTANVGSMPALAAKAAIDSPGDLEASESFIKEIQHDKPWQRDNGLNEVKQMQVTAGRVVEAKDEEIERLRGELEATRERADAYEAAVKAEGLGDDAEPQALIDAHTADLREEVAELEADAGVIDKKETRDRAEELEGQSVETLEARAGELALDQHRSDSRKKAGSNAIAATDTGTGSETLGGGSKNRTIEEWSDWAITARENAERQGKGMSASEYIEDEYDIDPSGCDDRHELQSAISEVVQSRTDERHNDE